MTMEFPFNKIHFYENEIIPLLASVRLVFDRGI